MLVALVIDAVASRTSLPRVTLLLGVGILAGPLVLDLLPPDTGTWFPVVSQIALVMVGFLIGGEFTRAHVRSLGRDVAVITLLQGLATAGVVAGGLVVVGVEPAVALLLGGVATATDPAATRAVVQDEQGDRGRRSRVADRLLGVVAIDDVVGIIVFSVLLAIAGVLQGEGGVGDELAGGAWETGGGLGVGLALGVPGAWLTDRVRPGQTSLEEALGLVFLCTGLSVWLGVSYLLAAVTLGATIANLSQHQERPIHRIEDVQWPFLVLFFVLAGASVDRDDLAGVLGVIAAYLVLRTIGKVVGGGVGARLVGEHGPAARWLGVGLLPQAGVAIGMALAALEQLPDVADDVVSVAVATTVVFELVGPFGVRRALTAAPSGESPRGESNS